jgi:hypothetical protein
LLPLLDQHAPAQQQQPLALLLLLLVVVVVLLLQRPSSGVPEQLLSLLRARLF